MSEINFDLFKCRCSAISAMLATSASTPCITEKQTETLRKLEAKETLTASQAEEMARLLTLKSNVGKVALGDTCISYLMEEYAWKTQGMVRVTKELMDIPQMQKGATVEPQSLALLSQFDEVEYKANMLPNGERERVSNDYIIGEVDAYVGEAIIGANKIPDIKSVWDYPTFLCKIQEKVSVANDWQIKGYMDITGAPEGFIANCLVDADEQTIDDIKWRLLKKTREAATEESPIFKKRWELIKNSLKFSHMPVYQRVSKRYIKPMTEFQRNQLYDRVKVCREWLWKFHEQYTNVGIYA